MCESLCYHTPVGRDVDLTLRFALPVDGGSDVLSKKDPWNKRESIFCKYICPFSTVNLVSVGSSQQPMLFLKDIPIAFAVLRCCIDQFRGGKDFFSIHTNHDFIH